MAKIERLSGHHLSSDRTLQRVIAAARADPGIWLMVKEREMEMRAIKAELRRRGADASEIDDLFPNRLTPSLPELADGLVSRMFGNCPPALLPQVLEALLNAAGHELDAPPQP